MIKAIITGATGMVGEGVLYECLKSPEVESVLIINRRPSGYSHPKLTEILHENFSDISAIADQITGYNACYFCLGVTSIGKDEATYTTLTYDLTLNFCKVVAEKNPCITICYISGAGTDSSENGKVMWSRVKGKTENDIMALPGVNGYAFRPGIIKPTKGLKFTQKGYKYFMWLFPVIKVFSANGFCTLEEIGLAMIEVTERPIEDRHVEVKDIRNLAAKNKSRIIIS